MADAFAFISWLLQGGPARLGCLLNENFGPCSPSKLELDESIAIVLKFLPGVPFANRMGGSGLTDTLEFQR